MHTALPMKAIGVIILILAFTFAAATVCQPERQYKEIETCTLVTDVARVLYACLHEGNSLVSQAPGQASVPNEINSYITQVLIDKQYLSATVLRHHGYLTKSKSGRDLLIDSWGRPLVFQIPALYPSGLIYSTAAGQTTILPLSSSAWPSEKGPVQVWSLGRNGADDRGQGDDVIPLN